MELKLKAEKLDKNEKIGKDFIPAVLYGKGLKNVNLKVKKLDFEKIFAVAGESNLIDLDYGAGSVKILVKDFQRSALKGVITHIDFYQVNMKEKVTTEIPLHFIGESKAVKELGGILIKEMHFLEVECLPGDLVDHLDVDVSPLREFDDAIRVNDLQIPAGLELTSDTNNIIAAVIKPKIEEEKPIEVPAAEDVVAAAPEAGGSEDDDKAEDKGKA
jgi:large subunit ribosomal protein L25